MTAVEAKRKWDRKITLDVQYPKALVDQLEIYEENFRRYINLPFNDDYFSPLNPKVNSLPLHDVMILKIAAWIYGLGVDWKLF